jgi:hypothetical protein
MCLAGLLCAPPAKSWVSPGLEYFCEEKKHKPKAKEELKKKNLMQNTNMSMHACLNISIQQTSQYSC